MQRPKRRKIILALLSAGASLAPLRAVMAGSVTHIDRGRPAEATYSGAIDAAMQACLLEATQWIASMHAQGQAIVPFPVSRLQRHFALGYSYTCTLAQLLVESGQWTIAFTADGARYAQLHPTAAPEQ